MSALVFAHTVMLLMTDTLFHGQRHGDTHGCDASRMNAAPEGVDAANVTLARSERLWSMAPCTDSYVHDGPSS